MPINAVVFDLDDTLFDDTASANAGLAALAEAHGNDWTPERRFRRHREIITELDPLVFSGELDAEGARLTRFERLLSEWGVTQPDAKAATQIYRRAYVEAYAECENALTTVKALKASGVKVGVLTNYLREVQAEKAERIGLLPLLDVLVCVDDVPAAKPDPRAFLAACEALGSLPENTLMVGDSLKTDVHGALAAGLQSVWYDRGQSDPAGVPTIRHLSELLPLINKEFQT